MGNNTQIVQNNIRTIENKIYFFTMVDNNTILELVDQVSKLQDLLAKSFLKDVGTEIELYINSPGGYLGDALCAVDMIQNSCIPIHTIVTGECSSAATLLSVVGHKRSMTKYAFMMIHEARTGFWGKFSDMKEQVENTAKMMNHIIGIYLKNTKIPKGILNKILKKDVILTSNQCLKYRLVDRII